MLSLTSAFPSLHYWWHVICCTDVSPKPLRGYFSSDFFQQMFPGPQVCALSPPLSRNSEMCSTRCGELQAPWQSTALTSLLLPGCLVTLSLSHRPACSPPGCLQTHYLGCTKQLSVLPGMNLDNCCGACARKEELISPIIQTAKFYFPVEPERKARCNS